MVLLDMTENFGGGGGGNRKLNMKSNCLSAVFVKRSEGRIKVVAKIFLFKRNRRRGIKVSVSAGRECTKPRNGLNV